MRRFLYLAYFTLFFFSSCATSSTPHSAGGLAKQPASSAAQARASLPGIKLPAGFQISIYASGLKAPRFMTIGPHGALLVANRAANSIVALLPGSSPMQAGATRVIASNLNDPTSLVMHNGYLYVGEGSSIARMALGTDLKAGPIQRIITDLFILQTLPSFPPAIGTACISHSTAHGIVAHLPATKL
jgi:glucose/arabinose dehydrogenase